LSALIPISRRPYGNHFPKAPKGNEEAGKQRMKAERRAQKKLAGRTETEAPTEDVNVSTEPESVPNS
jgi:hypothetical protein